MKQLVETRANIFYQKDDDETWVPSAELIFFSLQPEYLVFENQDEDEMNRKLKKIWESETYRTTATLPQLVKLANSLQSIIQEISTMKNL